ncbi:MAG: hypothetical protein JWQ02_2696 [Capsulimonas sp.]|jgi:hypothetical protein|nr:hypothetical protein [Capsulimonas sp.]
MKTMRFTLNSCMLFALLFLAVLPAGAKDGNAGAPAPQTYEMSLVRIGESTPVEYIFVIANAVGFKTVTTLKHFIGNLDADSILKWSPGCTRFGDEPLLSSEADMNDFKAFCASKHVKLIIEPSG